MKDIFENWDKFKRLDRRDEAKKRCLTLLENRKVALDEISREAAGEIQGWLKEIGADALPFNELFDGKMRALTPAVGETTRRLSRIIGILVTDGWQFTGQTKMSKQKKKELDTGKEYEVEEEVMPLEITKPGEYRVIPKGPKAGERIKGKDVRSTMTRVIQKTKNIELEDKQWFAKNQSFFTKEHNWDTIVNLFNTDEDSLNKSFDWVIVSRYPLDVLRMSDFDGITSCHSEGHEYWGCALAEAKGHGPVAYLVTEQEVTEFAEHKTGSEVDINDVDLSLWDNEEIFTDRSRGIEGITPRARLRLRQYKRDDKRYELAIPEKRVYGRRSPTFVNAVGEWAINGQKHFFTDKAGNFEFPEFGAFSRYGGSYSDNIDGALFYDFFGQLPGGKESYSEKRHSRLKHVGEDEDWDDDGNAQLLEEYELQVDDLLDQANRNLEYASVWAEVDEDGGEPYVSYGSSFTIKIIFDGVPDDEEVKLKELPSLEDTWSEKRAFFKKIVEPVFDNYDLSAVDAANVEVAPATDDDDDRKQAIIISFAVDVLETGLEGGQPDDLETFIDWLGDVEDNYKEIQRDLRSALVMGGYIFPNAFDNFANEENLTTLNQNLKNFVVHYDEDEHEIKAILAIEKGESVEFIDFKRRGAHIIGDYNLKDIASLAARKGQSLEPIRINDYAALTFGEFANKMKKKLEAMDKVAREWAAKQQHLDFGKEYEPKPMKPIDFPNSFMVGFGVLGFDSSAVNLEMPEPKAVHLGVSMQIVATDEQEEIDVVANLLYFMDRFADHIVQAAKASLDEIVAELAIFKDDERLALNRYLRKFGGIRRIMREAMKQSEAKIEKSYSDGPWSRWIHYDLYLKDQKLLKKFQEEVIVADREGKPRPADPDLSLNIWARRHIADVEKEIQQDAADSKAFLKWSVKNWRGRKETNEKMAILYYLMSFTLYGTSRFSIVSNRATWRAEEAGQPRDFETTVSRFNRNQGYMFSQLTSSTNAVFSHAGDKSINEAKNPLTKSRQSVILETVMKRLHQKNNLSELQEGCLVECIGGAEGDPKTLGDGLVLEILDKAEEGSPNVKVYWDKSGCTWIMHADTLKKVE